MTDRDWTGGKHRFTDPNAWTPVGTPTPGDSLRISFGTADARNTVLSGLSIDLYNPDPPPPPPSPLATLVVGNTVIAPNASISVHSAAFKGMNASIVVKGVTVNQGAIAVNQNSHASETLTIHIHNALFENLGTISVLGGFYESALYVEFDAAHAQFRNDGQIEVSGFAKLDASVLGFGTIDIERRGPGQPRVEAVRQVGAGQVIDFAGNGTDSGGGLVLDDVADFKGQIRNFGLSFFPAQIRLTGTDVSSFDYQGNSERGVLQLKSGCGTIGRIHFIGSYTTDEFQISHVGADSIVALKAAQ